MKTSLFAMLLLFPILAAASENPFDGHWKIDRSEGKSITFTLKSSSNGMTYSTESNGSWHARFDGKDYPIEPGVNGISGMTVSIRKLSDRCYSETIKSPSGEVRAVLTRTVSEDGKSLTLKTTMSWKEGNKENSRTVTQIAIKQQK